MWPSRGTHGDLFFFLRRIEKVTVFLDPKSGMMEGRAVGNWRREWEMTKCGGSEIDSAKSKSVMSKRTAQEWRPISRRKEGICTLYSEQISKESEPRETCGLYLCNTTGLIFFLSTILVLGILTLNHWHFSVFGNS